MIVLRTLGVLDLRDGQNLEVRSVLQQPKRLALLAFLTIATPHHRYHRRDSLLAMFWPELDVSHARAALRKSLHFLRASLGTMVVGGRGEEEVCVPQVELWCDAVAFDQAIQSGDLMRASELYSGDLLEGFHVSDAPAFQEWLDRERCRLRDAAAGAAWALADAAERSQDGEQASAWGRRAFGLTVNDEGALRRLLRLLNRVGDHSAIKSIYESFAQSLAQDDLEPESDTLALVDAIYTRPARLIEGETQVGVDRDQVLEQLNDRSPVEVGVSQVGPGQSPSDPSSAVRWPRSRLIAVAAALAIGGSLFLRDRQPALDPKRVVVTPFQNRTGLASLDPLGLIAADWIARGLSETRVVQVVDASAAPLIQTDQSARDGIQSFEQLGVKARAGTIVAGSYYRQGDTLYFEAKVFGGTRDGMMTPLAPAGALQSEPLVAIEALRQRTMIALASRLDIRLRDFPLLSQPPTYEAYRDFVEGIAFHIKRDYRRASREFLKAGASDSQFPAPLIFAAVDYFNLALESSSLQEFATADSLLRLAAKHRAKLTPIEVTTIDWLQAKLAGDNSAALEVSRRFSDLAPGSLWEFQAGYDAYIVNRPAEAIEILTRIDPDRGLLHEWLHYWSVLVLVYHTMGDHGQELRFAQRARERHGSTLDVLALEMGALAALGRLRELQTRVDEAEAARPTTWMTPGLLLMLVAEELRVHGHADASRNLLHRALRWYRDRPARERATQSSRAEYGNVLYSAEQWQAARTIFEELAVEDSAMVPYRVFLGLLAARRGDSVEAERISRDLSNVELPYAFGHVTYARACIASLLGQPERAVSLLRRAFAQGLMYGTHQLHIDSDLEPLRGYPPFEDLLRPRE